MEAEGTDSLPGDELVPEPKWSYTLGIGGFNTYQTLENMVGCKITNTTEIRPDHQHPAVGSSPSTPTTMAAAGY